MDKKRREIDLDARKIIIKLHKEGKSFREIGKIVERTHSSVQRVVQNFNSSGSLSSKPRSGRPRILTVREERSVLKMVKENPRISAAKIVGNVKNMFGKDIHKDTIRKHLKKSGYHGRVARRKPYISETNRKKRVAFAKEYINKPLEFWNRVIFSDESKYCIFGIKGRQIVWRKNSTAFDKENLIPTVKHGAGGVLVWGCMGANGVGNLHFIENIMDHKTYIDILKENLQSSADKIDLGNDFWFQQDNDPKHTAHNTKLWLLYNVKKQLCTPPQSPDLNPIEHLWDLLEKKIRLHQISSKQMLKEVLLREWENISPIDTLKLVQSMPKRLAEVIKRSGYPTSY